MGSGATRGCEVGKVSAFCKGAVDFVAIVEKMAVVQKTSTHSVIASTSSPTLTSWRLQDVTNAMAWCWKGSHVVVVTP